jgi:hypothetical protein
VNGRRMFFGINHNLRFRSGITYWKSSSRPLTWEHNCGATGEATFHLHPVNIRSAWNLGNGILEKLEFIP